MKRKQNYVLQMGLNHRATQVKLKSHYKNKSCVIVALGVKAKSPAICDLLVLISLSSVRWLGDTVISLSVFMFKSALHTCNCDAFWIPASTK